MEEKPINVKGLNSSTILHIFVDLCYFTAGSGQLCEMEDLPINNY